MLFSLQLSSAHLLVEDSQDLATETKKRKEMGRTDKETGCGTSGNMLHFTGQRFTPRASNQEPVVS